MNEETGKTKTAQDTVPAGINPVILFVDENIPELKDATEEEKYGRATEELEKNKLFHTKMEELFAAEPLIGQLIAAVINDKKTLLQAMAETISPEEYAELLENETSDIVETRNARLKKLDELEHQKNISDANVEESLTLTKKWLDGKTDWNEEKKADFLNKIIAMENAFYDGKISEAELDMLENAFYSGEKINAAREEGIITGRNEQIDDKLLKKEAETAGDGLPDITSAGGDIPQTPPQPGYFDDVITKEGERRRRLEAGRGKT
jgi:hypothetical protein